MKGCSIIKKGKKKKGLAEKNNKILIGFIFALLSMQIFFFFLSETKINFMDKRNGEG